LFAAFLVPIAFWRPIQHFAVGAGCIQRPTTVIRRLVIPNREVDDCRCRSGECELLPSNGKSWATVPALSSSARQAWMDKRMI
jgi:hypothetical protein